MIASSLIAAASLALASLTHAQGPMLFPSSNNMFGGAQGVEFTFACKQGTWVEKILVQGTNDPQDWKKTTIRNIQFKCTDGQVFNMGTVKPSERSIIQRHEFIDATGFKEIDAYADDQYLRSLGVVYWTKNGGSRSQAFMRPVTDAEMKGNKYHQNFITSLVKANGVLQRNDKCRVGGIVARVEGPRRTSVNSVEGVLRATGFIFTCKP